jgi:LAO/AO transport system kinase
VNSTIEAARPPLAPELWTDFWNGSRLACARLITKIENEPSLLAEIRDRLIPRQKGAVRIGITGPPGVGKSTVTAALARRAVCAGHKVGVIAVDPTSPFTGGAFLGDRVRMHNLVGDPNVFIRSQASRNGHGGLSPTTPFVADVFDAFGLDRILIETVGVGQAELDVMSSADLVVLVLQPGTGDVIQALKAGIIEVADLVLVNKSDMPGLEMILDSLRFLFEMNAGPKARPVPPLLTASAVKNQGIDKVHEALEKVIREQSESGRFREKRRARLEEEIKAAIQIELWERFRAAAGSGADIAAAAECLVADGKSPYPFIHALCSRVKIHCATEGPHGKSKR